MQATNWTMNVFCEMNFSGRQLKENSTAYFGQKELDAVCDTSSSLHHNWPVVGNTKVDFVGRCKWHGTTLTCHSLAI